MGHWKDLPYETRLQIVEELQNEEGSWKEANKQIDTIYQSFAYKTVSIRLSRSSKIYNAIINSPTKPGQYVKQVNLIQLSPPGDLSMMNPTNDPFYLLIKHTPKVKQVSITPAPQAKDWGYLAVAHFDNEIWKLQRLPTLADKIDNVSTYFNCAYHLRDILTVLDLTRGMVGRNDFGLLADLKQLTEPYVGKNVLKNLYDCSNLLRYLPHLNTFGVQEFQMGKNVDPESAQQNGNKNDIVNYNHVKRLLLHSYQPSRDDELLYIMEKYTGLEHFEMDGMTIILAITNNH